MFNLSNLFIALSITTGVASTTTPVSNTNENVVTEYTQYLNQTNTNTNVYSHTTGDPIVPNYYGGTGDKDHETRTNYTSHSSFLNINATKYETINTYGSNVALYVQNRRIIENNLDNYWKYTTTNFLVMQITTYNFNVGTKIQITNTMNIFDNTAGPSLQHWIISNRKFIKQVWTTTDNWASYVNMQQRKWQAQYIRSEIENVNNNFNYVKDQSLTRELIIGSDQGYIITDTTELELLPNTTNYVIIEYIPSVYAEWQYDNNEPVIDTSNEQVITSEQGTGISETNFKITGTNIITEGTNYEVIDIPGLMWQVLTMPFAFVSQAFNLTLFPGTPYQINISNLFLSILAIIAFVWLISFIIKLKG